MSSPFVDSVTSSSPDTEPGGNWLRPGQRLRLRARLTLAFGLGALLLSMVLAVVTYGLTRENLLARAERNAQNTAVFNKERVESRITSESTTEDIRALVQEISSPTGSNLLIRFEGDWAAKNPTAFGSDDVPLSLKTAVSTGQAAMMRTDVRNRPVLVLGFPLRDRGDAAFYESVSLFDVEGTLNSLGLALLGAGTVTTLAGVAFGSWAARRVLLPLDDVSQAAQSIAAGELETRLEVGHDRDLAPIADSFNEMVGALESRIERDARFASDVSHELRSPLMTLTASVEVLKNSSAEMPERARTALELLESDVTRFRQLVEDLLDISRFDVGAHSLALEPVMVDAFVCQVVRAAVSPSVRVDVTDEATDLVTGLDRRRLARIVNNLLDNAANYAGGASRVEIDADLVAVRIAVEDDGPGVPEDERERIFDRFARGAEGGRRGVGTGTGLGLALVSEHVKLHGGRVWVEDRPDGECGARFVVELPRTDDHEDDDYP